MERSILSLPNESELKSLYETADFNTALSAVQKDIDLAAVTRSEKGSIVVTPDNLTPVEAHAIDHLEDTTGAGDLYASGFLFGLTRDRSLADCARIGGLAAAEVIQHIGPRPTGQLERYAGPVRHLRVGICDRVFSRPAYH